MPFALPSSLTVGSSCLLDTNILIRLTERGDPEHQRTREAVKVLTSNGIICCYLPQNSAEAYTVMTRPATSRGGFGLTPEKAQERLALYRRVFQLLHEEESAYDEWIRLLKKYNVSGKQTHDTRIVAAMLASNISHILTFNYPDFVRFAPEGVVAMLP